MLALVSAELNARIVCDNSNNVWNLLSSTPRLPFSVERYDDLSQGLRAAQPGDLLLVLADGNNTMNGIDITATNYATAASKGLSVYIEMPVRLPGVGSMFTPIAVDHYKRLVVTLNGSEAATRRAEMSERDTEASSESCRQAGHGAGGSSPFPSLLPFDILQANVAFTQPYNGSSPYAVAANSTWLSMAMVAGCSSAVYGLPPANETIAALFNVSVSSKADEALSYAAAAGGGSAALSQQSIGVANVLIASIPLSNMVTGRYSPIGRWRDLWSGIVTMLLANAGANVDVLPFTFPPWDAPVRPVAATQQEGLRRAALAAQASAGNATARAELSALELQAVTYASDWLGVGSGLLIVNDNATCQAPFWPGPATNASASPSALESSRWSGSSIAASPPPALVCLQEGFGSPIAPNGSQAAGGSIRTDCNAEGAMAMAVRAWVQQQQGAQEGRSQPVNDAGSGAFDFAVAAAGLLNYTLLYSSAQQGPRNLPGGPQDGILAWYALPDPTDTGAYYRDDNARALNGIILATTILRQQPWGADTSLWDRGVIKSILANVRTCSAAGYSWGRINMPDFGTRGWKYWYYSSEFHQRFSCLVKQRTFRLLFPLLRTDPFFRLKRPSVFLDDYSNTLLLLLPVLMCLAADFTYATDPMWPQPHYQAQMWAVFLWAFARTGYTSFYTKVEAGM